MTIDALRPSSAGSSLIFKQPSPEKISTGSVERSLDGLLPPVDPEVDPTHPSRVGPVPISACDNRAIGFARSECAPLLREWRQQAFVFLRCGRRCMSSRLPGHFRCSPGSLLESAAAERRASLCRKEPAALRLIQCCFVDKEVPRGAQTENGPPEAMRVGIGLRLRKPPRQHAEIIRPVDPVDTPFILTGDCGKPGLAAKF